MDEYEQAIAEHAEETIANDLSWVEQLLDREREALDRSARDAAAPATAALRPPVVATKDLSETRLSDRVG
jgi:hypothetical protein